MQLRSEQSQISLEHSDELISLVYMLVFYSFNALLNITDEFTNRFYNRVCITGNVVI